MESGLGVFVSGRADQEIRSEKGLKFIPDNEVLAGRGIYSALISSLEMLKDDALFIPVDMDNTTKELIDTLTDDYDGTKIRCFLDSNGKVQAFPCIIPYSALDEILALQSNGVRFRHFLASSQNVDRIESHFDPEFRNFNSPKDLEHR
jgi:molybdopterin-guanine dinucleotide biosynthesis protein A